MSRGSRIGGWGLGVALVALAGPTADAGTEVDLSGEIRVRYEADGKSFDPDHVADPLARENMFAESGRGVYILRSFMDEVGFSFEGNAGTECRLVKYLPQNATPSND